MVADVMGPGSLAHGPRTTDLALARSPGAEQPTCWCEVRETQDPRPDTGWTEHDSTTCVLLLGLVVGVVMVVSWIIVAVSGRKRIRRIVQAVGGRTDFHADDVFLNRLNLSGISADAERRQLLLIRGEDHRLCAMSDVVAVEVLADGSAIVKANRGSQALGAVVGGALLGPLGLLAGAITGSTRSEDRIKKLALRVVTTDFERPNHDVLFFESASPKGDKRDSDLLRPALQLAEKWNSRLTSMLRDSKASADQQSTRPPISVADELRKLADLRRDGILTQDEFEAQKRRLLEQ